MSRVVVPRPALLFSAWRACRHQVRQVPARQRDARLVDQYRHAWSLLTTTTGVNRWAILTAIALAVYLGGRWGDRAVASKSPEAAVEDGNGPARAGAVHGRGA